MGPTQPPPAEAVRYHATTDADPSERIPWIKITASVEISGEWVTPEVIAASARQLADTITARLRAAVEDQ